MSKRRVVITGMGAVSCFGLGVDALWSGLRSGRSGQARIQAFDGSGYRSPYAAEVPVDILQREDLALLAGEPEEAATLLASLAAHQAFADAGMLGLPKRAAGCVVGTLCSSSQVFERYCRQFMARDVASRAGKVAACDASALERAAAGQMVLEPREGVQQGAQPPDGDVWLPADDSMVFPDPDRAVVSFQLEHLVQHFGLQGPSTLISTACSSSTDAIGCAADMIRNGEAPMMLAGGADILTEVVHAAFNAVFSITNGTARPFDASRCGFFIGEGAGMLVLEELEHALARGATIHGEVLGYGLSNTAFHLTATSDDGSGEALSVARCLTDAGVSADEIDYINAHGTATRHNDLTETRAIRSLFSTSLGRLAVSSIKPNIGHCMGASGALEAIATLCCIKEDFIPPTLNSSGDLDAGLRIVVGAGLPHVTRYAISQSFGFGGACSSLLLGKAGLVRSAAEQAGSERARQKQAGPDCLKSPVAREAA